MRDVDRPAVAVADRERRARDRLVDPERAAGAADERRLARAELARDEDDVTGREQRGRAGPPNASVSSAEPRLELEHAAQKRPSCTGCRSRPSARGDAGGASSATGTRACVESTRPASPPAEQLRQPRDVLLERRRASTACRARRPGGRAGRATTRRPPSVTSCSCPWTRVIPSARPESSLVAKFPSVATTRGRTSSICRKRCGSHAADLLRQRIAVLRRPALEHVREVDVVARQADAAEQPLEQLARLPCERRPLPGPRGSREPRRRASARRPGHPRRRRPAFGPRRAGSARSRPSRRRYRGERGCTVGLHRRPV